MAVLEAIAAGVGAGASAAALLTGAVATRGWTRARRQRRYLGDVIYRLVRLDHWISIGAQRLDARLATGVGWAGIDLWPEKLSGGLLYLHGIHDELERRGAELRSLDDANLAVGRLRDDAEAVCQLLALAADRYTSGTTAAYRECEGEAMPPSAAGRDPSPTLTDIDLDGHRADRARMTWLLRSCLLRVAGERVANDYQCQWPIQRRDCERIAPCLAAGSSPMPIDWDDDLPALD